MYQYMVAHQLVGSTEDDPALHEILGVCNADQDDDAVDEYGA